MKLPELALPDYPVRVTLRGGKPYIHDSLRDKYVAFTPEEYVRQRFTAWLIHDLHYPRSLMGNEVSLTYNGTLRRCDTLVADRRGEPFMIIEYKAPSVSITQAVFDQIARYNMVLCAPYIVVSNGLNHYCCRTYPEANTYHFLPQIPDWMAAMHGPMDN